METISRLRGQITRAREQTEAIAGRAMNGGITVAAGYGLGMAINKFGTGGRLLVPGTDMDAGLVGGGLLLVAGVAGLGGEKYSEPLVSAGAGLLAGQLAISTYQDGKVF